MVRVSLAVSDGALRCNLPEHDWLPLTAGLRHLQLPDVFVPPDPAVAAWCAAAGIEPGTPDVLDAEEELVRRALRLKASALVEVELQASVCGEGIMVLAWTNGTAASSLTRDLVVPADEIPRLVDGVLLSAFPVHRLVAETLRRLPSGGPTPADASPVTMAPADARALVLALRRRHADEAGRVARLAGYAEPPILMRALATGLIGEASLTVRGLQGVVRARFVLCEVGWVEVAVTAEGLLQHTPYDERGIRDLLAAELTAQLSDAA